MPKLVDARPDWLAPLDDPKSEAILRAAFDVFEENGLHCATMQEVAKRARVSKETLYARFDSKEGLFFALLAWGARQAEIEEAASPGFDLSDPFEALAQFGAIFITRFTRPESIAVFRMAAAEAARSPEIGRAFQELPCLGDREALRPILHALSTAGMVEVAEEKEFHDAYIGLLHGTMLIDLVAGVRAAPDAAEAEARGRRAATLLVRAFAPERRAHAIAAE